MKISKRIASIAFALVFSLSAFLAVPSLNAEAKTKSAASGVTIAAALIQGTDVVVTTSGASSSEDGLYHLVASDANQTAPAGVDVAQATAASGATFSVPLGKGTASGKKWKCKRTAKSRK